jgi:hypothetical protein
VLQSLSKQPECLFLDHVLIAHGFLSSNFALRQEPSCIFTLAIGTKYCKYLNLMSIYFMSLLYC